MLSADEDMIQKVLVKRMQGACFVCVRVYVAVCVCSHLALSLSGSVRVLGAAERLRQTAVSCGPHRLLTVCETGEVAFLPVCLCKLRLKGCRKLHLKVSNNLEPVNCVFKKVVVRSVAVSTPIRNNWDLVSVLFCWGQILSQRHIIEKQWYSHWRKPHDFVVRLDYKAYDAFTWSLNGLISRFGKLFVHTRVLMCFLCLMW